MIAHKENKSINLLGVRIDKVSMNEALIHIEQMIRSNNGHYVVPINPEMIMEAQENEKFRDVINKASLILADGIGVVFSSWIIREPLKERVTGVDTVKNISRSAAINGWRMFLLGAADGVAEKTAKILQSEFSKLEIAGFYSGSPAPEEEEKICNIIKLSGAHILMVAYGAPKQELWVARNLHRFNVPLVMCVGGAFDFISGVTKRAPRWLQSLGLEWFYRLIHQPWRWRRMLALPRFVVKVCKEHLFTSQITEKYNSR
jgi:N-acetylglucosaminyldiphosphoundecaprenol N-acetyl-beta-D-mannosaminyltransferase